MSHELDAPPWLRVETTLMNAANHLRDAYDARLAHLGLNLSHASLLAYVHEYGPVNQTRAAEHLGQGRASTGSQVDRLQELGMIRRISDPSDRRAWLLELTETGVEHAAAVGEVDKTLRGQLRAGISRDERQQLAKLLVRLQKNLAAAQSCEVASPSIHPTTPTVKGAL